MVYDATLNKILSFAPRKIASPTATTFYFDAITGQGKQVVQVEISEEVADLPKTNIPWFSPTVIVVFELLT